MISDKDRLSNKFLRNGLFNSNPKEDLYREEETDEDSD